MSLEVKAVETKTKYPRIGEGTYMARVVGVVDIGQHVRSNWQTQEVEVDKFGNQIIDQLVFINYELPSETIEIDGEEKPRWMSKEYKVSFFEKSALTHLMNALGGGFKTLDEMLDKACMITIGTTSGGKDKIVAVAPMLKGMQVPDLQNPTQTFDIDNPDMGTWGRLPVFMQVKIQEALNFPESELNKKLNTAQQGSEVDEEDPFDEDDKRY